MITVAGVLFVAFATHRLSLWREKQARQAAACADFRAVFNTDIAEIANPARLPDIYVYLARRFPMHDAAVRELSTQLPWFRRKSLAKDWAAYGNSIDDIRQRYSDEAGHAEAIVRRHLAVERLEKVVTHGAKS